MAEQELQQIDLDDQPIGQGGDDESSTASAEDVQASDATSVTEGTNGTDASNGTDVPHAQDESNGTEAVEAAPVEASADAPEADTDSPEQKKANKQAKADHEIQTGLLSGLARAMHDAAEAEYGRIAAELDQRHAEQLEAIAGRVNADAEDLKVASENDISAIDAWAKAENEKVKLERLRRIDLRREQLAEEVQRQETIREREVLAVQAAIEAHRVELLSFFARLKEEVDPGRIAEVAGTLPPIPSLPDIADVARRGAAWEFASLDQDEEMKPRGEAQDRELTVSETRLMSVVDPAPKNGSTPPTEAPSEAPTVQPTAAPDWEAPHAVAVPARPRLGEDGELPARVGSTLLRAVKSIRPVVDAEERERAAKEGDKDANKASAKENGTEG